jgi:hypothetical protein
MCIIFIFYFFGMLHSEIINGLLINNIGGGIDRDGERSP